VSELIVKTALFTVPQDLVGFSCLLESFFGVLVAGVAVWMEFESQLAVGGFELVSDTLRLTPRIS